MQLSLKYYTLGVTISFCKFCFENEVRYCHLIAVMYPEFFWADWLHLGVTPPFFHHRGWQKFLNLVPPDALKMHSLTMPVLRFLCKTFSKLGKLNNETLFSVDV